MKPGAVFVVFMLLLWFVLTGRARALFNVVTRPASGEGASHGERLGIPAEVLKPVRDVGDQIFPILPEGETGPGSILPWRRNVPAEAP